MAIHDVEAPLDVVCVVSNPVRYEARWRLFNEFVARMRANPRVRLTALELQHGARPYATSAQHCMRTDDELWHKENMINLAVQRLPDNWEYVAFVDADVEFSRQDWAEETLHQLQNFRVVQMFSHCADLGPEGEIVETHKGFGYLYNQGAHWRPADYGAFMHPGYAWAMRRQTWNDIGGLVDFAILGMADHHMALAWIGMVDKSFCPGLSEGYRKRLLQYQARCERTLLRDVGHVKGTILHSWHGKKKDRRYKERTEIFVDNDYDPDRDLHRDWQGLWKLDPRRFQLRDDIRAYFRARNEDSVDMD